MSAMHQEMRMTHTRISQINQIKRREITGCKTPEISNASLAEEDLHLPRSMQKINVKPVIRKKNVI